MEINVAHGENLVISLKGRLDTVTSLEFQKAVDAEPLDENLVIIDMKELEYISSAGLRALIALKKKLQEKQKRLEIHNLNDVCTEVFKVTGFINVLDVK